MPKWRRSYRTIVAMFCRFVQCLPEIKIKIVKKLELVMADGSRLTETPNIGFFGSVL